MVIGPSPSIVARLPFEAGAACLVEGGDVVAGGADAPGVGVPPLLEGGVDDPDRERDLTDVTEPCRLEQRGQLALALAEQRDEVRGEHAGTAADVDDPVARGDPDDRDQLARQRRGVAPHEPVVGLSGHVEGHPADGTPVLSPRRSPI